MRIEIRGNHFELLPERALYWYEQEALICSDLHWGRELLLQKYGMPIPSLSFSLETSHLENILSRTQAKQWWILGDLIHHPEGLDPTFIFEMKSWMHLQLESKLDNVIFVPGNHDRKFYDWSQTLPFEIANSGIIRDNFRFLHEPPIMQSHAENHLFSWYGHLHPAIVPPMLGTKKLPCFWVRETEGFLPAFSRLAGGFSIQPEQNDSIFVIADQQVMQMY